MNDKRIDIDLNREIRALTERWNELNELWIDPPGPTSNNKTHQMTRIENWMAVVTEKKLALGRIKAESEASLVTVTGLTEAERAAIERALADLHRVIQRDQIFASIISNVTSLLTAVGTVAGAADRA